MRIRRRSVLKMLPIAAAGLTASRKHISGLFTHALAEGLPPTLCRVYRGPNLAGWKTELGDALYVRSGEPPVDSSDIQTVHYPSYSELCANIKRRIIMAHNITFYRIIDTTALRTV